MNIVWMFGNGFDIHLGLKTSYKDFYQYYLSVDNDNPVVKQFKQDLSDNIDTWADLELILGDYSKNFVSPKGDQDYVELIYDIQDELAKYLKTQNGYFEIEPSQRIEFLQDLVQYESSMTEFQKQNYANVVKKTAEGKRVKIITFNYTSSLDRICAIDNGPIHIPGVYSNNAIGRLESIEHIHGTLNEYMILGIDNATQLSNSVLAKSEEVLHTVIKSIINTDTETLRDKRCESAIKFADVVCVYGMSFGATDKKWWELLIDLLKDRKIVLIIFGYQRDLNMRQLWKRGEIRQAIADRFLSHVQLTEEDKNEIMKRVFVCVNAPIFNVTRITY